MTRSRSSDGHNLQPPFTESQMKYDVIKGRELADDLAQSWSEIQQRSHELASPYFRPELTRIISRAKDDVYVTILENAGRVVGFFPFHRQRGGVGRPVGLRLSDYHGVIAEPETEWTVEDLLRGSGLVRFEFDHLPLSQEPLARSCRSVDESPIIDLSGGYGSFEASRDKNGRKLLREIERKSQRLEMEVGPLRYVEHTESSSVLRTLMDWKSAQCRRTGAIDFLSIEWCRRVIEAIHEQGGAHFAGRLSCLYAGEELAATHFILQSNRVRHSWLPAYNNTYADYSPGMILLREMIRSAAKAGAEYIDLGKHVTLYKKRFMTGAIPIATGSAEIPSFLNGVRHVRDHIERWGKASVFRPVLRVPGRIIKRAERQKLFD
jgi:CelD/BcsL family acetyltransferase involved in cellulose biosynthesis